MNLLIPGEENREYTTVKAPHTFQAPAPHLKKKTPTFVMRKTGEAWNKPFVVAYEPFVNDASTVMSIQNLVYKNKIVASIVISEVAGKTITDALILSKKVSEKQTTLTLPNKVQGMYFVNLSQNG